MKKLLSIVLVIMMILSMVALTGCNKEGSKGDIEKSSTQDTKTTTEEPVEEKVEPVTLKVMGVDSYDTKNSYANGLPIINELEKRTNVKFEWELYPVGDYSKVIQTRIAAGLQLGDIVNAKSATRTVFAKYVEAGLFTPLNNLIDKYAPNIKKTYEEEYPILMKRHTLDDGNIYDIKRLEDNPIGCIQVDFIRKDWLDKAGIKKIPETTDELYQALKAMQDMDVNDNGKKDERWYGLTYQLLINFQQAFGSKVKTQWDKWGVYDNDQVVCEWTTDAMKNTYAYLNKLYTENLIDPEYLAMGFQTDKLHSLIASNVVAVTPHAVRREDAYNQMVSEYDGEYVTMPRLKGPNGEQSYVMTLPPAGDNGDYFVITKECENPEAAIKLLDYLYSPEGRLLSNYGIEGEDYKMENGVPKLLEPLKAENNPRGIRFLCLPRVEKMQIDLLYEESKVSEGSKDVYDKILSFVELPYESAIPTQQEMDAIDEVGNDLWTYVEEMRGKFITGFESLDNWDKYVEKCNELGLEKLRLIEQKRYDRFISK